MKSSLLPPQILKCMSESDRKSLGKAGMLPHEINQISETRSEAQLQKLIYLELNRRNIFFHYSRTDKKTRSLLGTPDFAFCSNCRYVAIECKTETGQLTKEQEKVSKKIKDNGGLYFVVRSFEQFIHLLHTHGL